MKTLEKYVIKVLWLSLLFFCACREEDEAVITPSVSSQVNIQGYVQKGPFVNGTTITISELNDSLGATGRTFITQVTDNKGSFSSEAIELDAPFVQIIASGFYFDEVKGEKSAVPLTLFTLAEVKEENHININLLSHLTKDRIISLIKQGKTFTTAKQQAQQEVLAMFGISKEDIASAEQLDISQDGDDNAILLAISAILQGQHTVGELSELLANIITDIKEDGTLDEADIQKKLRQQATGLKLPAIRNNLEKRYEELRTEAKVANFEKYVDSDGDGILNKDEDDTPDEFTFTTQKDVAVSTSITSNEVIIGGLKAGGYADAYVINGKLVHNGTPSSDTLVQVKNGDKIKLMLTSSSQYATPAVAKLSIGSLHKTFEATTGDYKPDAFSFTAIEDVKTDSLYRSAEIIISGLPYPAPAHIQHGTLIKNGEIIREDSAMLVNGDKVVLQLLSGSQYQQATEAALNINGVAASFTITTDDYKPDDFSFASIQNAQPDSVYFTNTVSLTGLLYPTKISLSEGTLYINGKQAPAGNELWVQEGDQIMVQIRSKNEFAASYTSAVLTIGSLEKPVPVTTMNNPWRMISQFPKSTDSGMCGFTIGDKIYAGLSSFLIDTINSKKFYEYDIKTKVWKGVADFRGLAGRRDAFSFSNNGKGYILSGSIYKYEETALKDFWEYDPNNNTWRQLPDLTYPLYSSSDKPVARGFLTQNTFYMEANATDSFRRTINLYEFDFGTNIWSQTKQEYTEEYFLQIGFGFTLNGKIYKLDQKYVDPHSEVKFLEFNPFDKSQHPSDISDFVSFGQIGYSFNKSVYPFVINETVYLVTRDTYTYNLVYYRYNFANRAWQIQPGLKVGLPETDLLLNLGVSADGKAYFLFDNELWEFTPSQE